MNASPTTPISLLGSALTFDRCGTALLAIEPEAISVVELGPRGRTFRLPIADVRAAVGFDDQLWIVTHRDMLIRVDRFGHPIGSPETLPFSARARLDPAPCGPPAAIWASELALIDDFGEVARTELAEPDLALPLTGRRFVTVRGAKLTLPSGLVVPLAPSTTVLGGVVMSDGKRVTLLVAHAGGRQLVVFSLGTGQIVQQCAVPSPTIRIATRRGIAIAQPEPRVLWVLDLQAGRALGSVRFDHEVEDFAIDPDGRRVATRASNGSIELHELAELLRPATAADEPLADDDDDDDDVITSAPHVNLAPSPVVTAELVTPLSSAKLSSLDARVRPQAIDVVEARRQLDRALRVVSLRALAAIAIAWDTRKLGYGNEGKHPYELEVGAILGMNRGFADDYVTAAHAELDELERTITVDPRWRGRDTPVGLLVSELALDPLELDIVLAVAAPALAGRIARLYGILANDGARGGIDELLVQDLLDGYHDAHAIAAALDPQSRLVRLGIVQLGGKRARPFAELTVDQVILDRLRVVAPAFGAATTIRASDRALDELDVPRDALEGAISDLARPGDARLVVRGPVGSGRRTVACSLADRAGRDLAVIDATALARVADRFVVELARALRRAQLSGLVPCIVNLAEVTFDEHAGRALAAETLRSHPGPIVFVASTDEPVPVASAHVEITLPVLAETARRDVWVRALADAKLELADVDAVAARYKIGPGVIRRAVAAASATPDDAAAAIDAYVRHTRDARLGTYARRVERLATWSSVVFPPDILDSLRELVARVRYGRQVYDTWGMGRTMSTSRGLTALFQGQPGTGKTLVAGVIARELGLDLYQVDLSKVMSKWIGETERNLSTIFDAAEDGQVVLLFDEADSLFAKRTEVRSSNDRYANLEVNYLLQRLDSFTGIAILTTNSGNTIDQAFKRRLSFRLSFPFPDEETREQLWRAHLPPELPVTGPLALGALARKYQLSGGYIRNACLRAAFLAAQDETSLHQRHLERAVALEFAELGKLSNGGAIS